MVLRKRSEIGKSSTPGVETRVSTPATIDYFVCPKCGLRQSRGVAEVGGKPRCIRCEAGVDTSARPAEVEVPRAAPVPAPPGDPWQLKPESQVPPPKQPVPDPPMRTVGGEIIYTDLARAIEKRVGSAVPLPTIAAWTPAQRRVVAGWVNGEKGFASEQPPDFLAKELDGNWGASEGVSPVGRPGTSLQNPKDGLAKIADKQTLDSPIGESANGLGKVLAEQPDRVSYTWGEEKFSPVPGSYSTVVVGQMTISTCVRPGEDHAAAMRRIIGVVLVEAEAERDRKCRSFLRKLLDMGEGINGKST